MSLPHVRQLVLAMIFSGLAAATASAALIGDTTDTFSNTNGQATLPPLTPAQEIPAEYTAFNSNDSQVTVASLQSEFRSTNIRNADNDFFTDPISEDRNALGDGVGDGFLNLFATGAVAGVRRTLGTVASADVGSSIEIDVAYELTNDANINLTEIGVQRADGSGGFESVGGLGTRSSNLFTGQDLDVGAGLGLLSLVPTAPDDPSSVLGPVRYTVLPSDVGKELFFVFQGFVGGSFNGIDGRHFALDAVQITVTPIPEPATTTLLGLMAVASLISLRQRRR